MEKYNKYDEWWIDGRILKFSDFFSHNIMKYCYSFIVEFLLKFFFSNIQNIFFQWEKQRFLIAALIYFKTTTCERSCQNYLHSLGLCRVKCSYYHINHNNLIIISYYFFFVFVKLLLRYLSRLLVIIHVLSYIQGVYLKTSQHGLIKNNWLKEKRQTRQNIHQGGQL